MDGPPLAEVYAFDGFRLDPAQRLLSRNGVEIPLAPRAVEILLVLVEHRGRVVGKEQLLDAVWKEVVVEESNLYGYLHTLRNALGNDPGGKPYLETLRRRGYRFNGVVGLVAGGGDRPRPGGPAASDGNAPAAQLPGPSHASAVSRRGRLALVAALAAIAFVIWAFGLVGTDSGPNAEPPPPLRTLAVLPFKPVAAGMGNEALEIGMADTLIGMLGRSELTVRPTGAVRRFSAPDQDPIEAGRQLGVDVVLDGTIHAGNERVRVTASLWRVADGRQLWAGKFDEDFSGILDIQDSISQRVATAVQAELPGGNRRYTQNTEAYRLYLLGNHHAQRLTPQDHGIAIRYFREAIALDPDYPWPYVGIATANLVNVLSADAPPSQRMPEGKAAALKAVALAPELSEAHVALGTIMFFHDWDWDQALAHLRLGHDLGPNLEDTNLRLAHVYSNLGRHEEAIRLSNRAGEIAPLSPRRWALHGQILFYAGRYDESIRHLRRAIETLPDFWLPRLFIQRPYLEKGMYAEAIEQANLATRHGSGSMENIVHKAWAYAKLGDTVQARRLLAELERTATSRHVGPYLFALVHNALGDTAQAMALLEQAYRQRDWRMTFLKVDPRWDNMRSEPRFVALMRKMKFDQPAPGHGQPADETGGTQPAASASAARTMSSSPGITRNAAPASGV